ncbi:MAG: trypsin-like serine protease [bacterium]|nr:trypsin-like serine protease [bacterium]
MMRALVVGVLIASVSPCNVSNAQESSTISELFEQVNPSVVEIMTTQNELAPTGGAQWVKQGGLGSGVLISAKGDIMTAAHVVQTAEQVEVRWLSGAVSAARIIASDPMSDVALLRAEEVPDDARIAVLGNSDLAKVGDQVFVIGAPLGIRHTLTVGYVSARRIPQTVYSGLDEVELLQTDAAINKGNSGGPMFNLQGEVIGIVSHIISQSGGSEGLGFVITSNLARTVLLDERTMWSGMEAYVLQGAFAQALNLPQPEGLLVQRVASGSPASTLGLKPGTFRAVIEGQTILLGGDVLLEIGGFQIGASGSDKKIDEYLRNLGPDQLLVVTVLRGGERITLRKVGYLLRTP